jgi:hypothetical protein
LFSMDRASIHNKRSRRYGAALHQFYSEPDHRGSGRNGPPRLHVERSHLGDLVEWVTNRALSGHQ